MEYRGRLLKQLSEYSRRSNRVTMSNMDYCLYSKSCIPNLVFQILYFKVMKSIPNELRFERDLSTVYIASIYFVFQITITNSLASSASCQAQSPKCHPWSGSRPIPSPPGCTIYYRSSLIALLVNLQYNSLSLPYSWF